MIRYYSMIYRQWPLFCFVSIFNLYSLWGLGSKGTNSRCEAVDTTSIVRLAKWNSVRHRNKKRPICRAFAHDADCDADVSLFSSFSSSSSSLSLSLSLALSKSLIYFFFLAAVMLWWLHDMELDDSGTAQLPIDYPLIAEKEPKITTTRWMGDFGSPACSIGYIIGLLILT